MTLFRHLKNDLPASVVVFFVAVPLCLGIALASGAPLFSGLIAGIVGGIIVGSLSGSPLGVSGPAAGLAVIVLTSIEDLGAFDAFLLAVVLAGGLQVVLGLARAGVLAYFFPSSVIKGMLAGIGLLIFLKQIPHALGHDSDPEGDFSFQQPDGDTTLSSLSSMLGDFTPAAIVISVTCLAILILWETRLMKGLKGILPGPLVAVIFGVVYQLLTSKGGSDWALDPTHLVNVPVAKGFDEMAALLTYPDWSQIANKEVWIIAVTIAIVASLETLLCVEATDKLDPEKRVTPTNRELFAQGVGNMVSGAVGGLPVTQVIVRSSANIQSGGKTKLSAILHGVFMLVFVLALPGLLNMIPLAALAAILLVVGYKLAKPQLFMTVFRQGWAQFLPFVVTVLGIVFTDLLTGIMLGMVVAIFVILRTHYLNSHLVRVREGAGEDNRRAIRIELAEQVTFLHRGAILKELDGIPSGTQVTIDASNCILIDADVQEILDDFEATAPGRDIRVEHVAPETNSQDSNRSRQLSATS